MRPYTSVLFLFLLAGLSAADETAPVDEVDEGGFKYWVTGKDEFNKFMNEDKYTILMVVEDEPPHDTALFNEGVQLAEQLKPYKGFENIPFTVAMFNVLLPENKFLRERKFASAVPAVLLGHNGQINEYVGAQTVEAIKDWVLGILVSPPPVDVSHVIQVTKDSLAEFIAAHEVVLLMGHMDNTFFSAQVMQPFADFAQDLQARVTDPVLGRVGAVAMVECTEVPGEPRLCKSVGFNGYPTMLLLINGEKKGVTFQLHKKEKIMEWLQQKLPLVLPAGGQAGVPPPPPPPPEVEAPKQKKSRKPKPAEADGGHEAHTVIHEEF